MNGGPRKGSGRKKSAFKHATAIQLAEETIKGRLPKLLDKLFELADGVTCQTVDKDGHEIIYTRIPDRQAIEYLINRVCGKPTEKLEHSGSLKEIVTIEYANGKVVRYGERDTVSTSPIPGAGATQQ
jgi:hypothetical protein